jgi:hypothetical protein
MNNSSVNITVKGKWVEVPALHVDGKTVVCTGKWIRKAELHEEEWGQFEPPGDVTSFVAKLKSQKPDADYFTFAQTVCDVEPRHSCYMEWDNAAAICTRNFSDWWENHLPQVTRKNVRRSQKRGVSVELMKLDDATIGLIHRLYGQIQTKQGSQFAHQGKDFETVKRELSTFADRSEFIGAFHENVLIGFIKMVYMGKVAGIMHIVTRNEDYDKRPANALVTKAVQVCEEKGMSYLIYGKYTYGNKTKSSLTEYKKRNGFEKMEFPRYFVPLTLKGEIAIRLRFHRGMLGILPGGVINVLLAVRTWLVQKANWCMRRSPALEGQAQD